MPDFNTAPDSTQNDIEHVEFTDMLSAVDRFWEPVKDASTRVLYALTDSVRANGPAMHQITVWDAVESYGGCVSEALAATRVMSWLGIVDASEDKDEKKEKPCKCDSCTARRTTVGLRFDGYRVRDWIVKDRQQQVVAEQQRKELHRQVTRPVRPSEGSVYLIKAGDRYKIGVARDVLRRMAQLNAGQSPFPIVLIHCASGWDYKEQENRLHQKYSEYRVHGEWFEFDDRAVTSVITELDAWAVD